MARSSGFLDTLLTSPTTERYRVGISLLFLLGVWLTVGSFSQGMPNSMLLMAAAVIGGYMAINIGANDVANNVGPAVGSGALSLGAAVLIAAVFEAGGAIIAGGDVVSTIKGGIIDPSNLEESRAFVWLMTAALLAGAL
ncbi:MAG TPA: inorganic phosphate transporter, partial [Marinobacter adhaerens]|nr:inorganic phosphate transporter [Marinobacter adhaerens]